MAYALLSLPPHLLHAALTGTSAAATNSAFCLFGLLKKVPAPLHTAVLAAGVNAGVNAGMNAGALAVPLHFSRTLHLLSRTTVPAPALLRLDVAGAKHGLFKPTHPRLTDATAAILARALTAHPSLTSVHLASSQTHPKRTTPFSQWLTKLTACLAPSALSSLSTLHIQVIVQPSICCSVIRLLYHLPQLTSLAVDMQHEWHLQDLNLRTSMPSIPPSTAAARPAALSRLAKLSLNEDWPEIYDKRRPAGTMASCKRLRPKRPIPNAHVEVLVQLLQSIHAPAATSVSITACNAQLPPPQLLGALHQCSELRRLCIGVLPDGSICMCSSGGEDAPATVQPELHLPLTVQELELRGDTPVGPLAMAAALAQHLPAAADVTSLRLAPPDSEACACVSYDRYWCVRGTSDAWGQLTAALCHSSVLQSLALNVIPVGLETPATPPLAAALLRLSALTNLSLQSQHHLGRRASQDTAALRAADVIPALRQRQQLCSRRVHTHIDSPLQVLDACSVLGALTHLGVLCREVACDEVAGRLQRMQGVKGLDLLCSHFHDKADRDQFASHIPGVALTVQHLYDSDAWDSWPYDLSHSEESIHKSSSEDF
eukprot:jgi/Ulvmu1/3431/UM016_0050.1